MTKGYGIFSGGLDSILAAVILKDQGIDVRLITFQTPFFGADRALESGRKIGLVPRVVDLTGPHLDMMQNPRHGFGRFMNPCIDCHALMFRKAGDVMVQDRGDFLFSGEVLGQRPKSQNRRALDIVAKESGFARFILRPLSALALPPTHMENDGLVDRSRLQGFQGRTRKPQMALAAGLGIEDYPSPAGGCLLTDPVFSRRLAELMDHSPALDRGDVEFLKAGRHFRLPGGTKIVVGRNQADNDVLEGLAQPGDVLVKVMDMPGPTVVIPNGAEKPSEADIELAAAITASYSGAADGQPCRVSLAAADNERTIRTVAGPKAVFAGLMV